MKFKINRKTKLYLQLVELDTKINKAEEAGFKFAQKQTGIEKVSVLWGNRPLIISGGLLAVGFKKPPQSPGWREVDYKDDELKFYTPDERTKEGKALAKEINELPFVGYKELNDLVNLNWRDHGKNLNHPGYMIREEYALINMPNWVNAEKYKPAIGMIEITEGEYNKLKNQKDVKKKNKAKA